MVTIVTRSGKGSPLTNNEMDDNLNNLNNGKTENSSAAITGGTINGATIGATTPSTIAGTIGTFSNNVGIGTSSPTAALDVVGNGVFRTTGATQITLSDSDGGFAASKLNVENGGRDFRITAPQDLIFETSTIERLRIDANGKIGIGGANYGTSGQTIVSAGSGAAPAWGILPVAGGGTGVTTAPAEAARLKGFTSTTTSDTITTLTNTSTQYQYFTGGASETVDLPFTSTLTTGWSFHIVNDTSTTIIVRTATGNSFGNLFSGLSATITCINTTGDAITDWDYGLTSFPSVTGTGSLVRGTNATIATPTITNAVVSQSNAVRANGTLALAFGTNQFVQVTPTATGTFTTTVPVVGTSCTLIVLTSGTTSYTMTFGTGFRTTSTLATGTTSARRFVIQFVSDGTSLIESGRTTAIA
jgi:hypothetical protein